MWCVEVITFKGSGRGQRRSRDGREIAESLLFDLDHYSRRTGILFKSRPKAIRHFLQSGGSADPHPLFSMEWYLKTYPDIQAAGINPLLHFLRHGDHEGRSPSAYFDTSFYHATYPDIVAARVNALSHYLQSGASEGRNPSAAFNSLDYLAANPDVAAAGANPLVHYADFGEREGRKLSDRPFMLDTQYGMLEADFLKWREQLVRRRHVMLRSSVRNLIIVESSFTKVGYKNWVSIRKAAEARGTKVELCVIDDIVRVAASADHASLVLFLERGDHLDPAGLDALIADGHELHDLILFDMFYKRHDRVFPILQPGANPQYLRAADSVFSRFAISGPLLGEIVGDGARGAREILLAALDVLEVRTRFGGMRHVAMPVLQTPSLEAAIVEWRGKVILENEANRIEAPQKEFCRRVSVVICTKDNGVLLDQLLRHLTTSCPAIKDICIVSNDTSNFVAKQTLNRWKSHRAVSIILYPGAFNFSDQCNLGVAQTSGDLLLFLNDDIVGLDDVWLQRLVDHIQDPGVGIVGPRLLYPNERVQHAGMYLGFHRSAGHTMRHARLPDQDYMFMATCSRDVSCVTGAVLLVRRSTFEDLGGFDIQLRTSYQDVDLCLRVRGLGHRVLYVPSATLIHLESVTINELLMSQQVLTQRLAERAYFWRQNDDGRLEKDPFHNSLYEKNDESLRALVRW